MLIKRRKVNVLANIHTISSNNIKDILFIKNLNMLLLSIRNKATNV